MSLYEEISKATAAEVVKQSTLNCVRLLSDKYGFDPDEALVFLSPNARPPKVKSKKHFTGYLLFSDTERPKIQKRLAAKFPPEQKISPTLVVQNIAHRWRKLSRSEREEWNNRAAGVTPVPPDVVVSSPVPSPVVSPVPYTNPYSDLEEQFTSLLSEMGPDTQLPDSDVASELSFTMV